MEGGGLLPGPDHPRAEPLLRHVLEHRLFTLLTQVHILKKEECCKKRSLCSYNKEKFLNHWHLSNRQHQAAGVGLSGRSDEVHNLHHHCFHDFHDFFVIVILSITIVIIVVVLFFSNIILLL